MSTTADPRVVAATSRGLTLPSLLFVVFLVLKLTHVIDWSWWLVSLPLWAIPVAFLCVILIGTPFIMLVTLVGKKKR